MNTILEIKNLHANIGNTKILKGINISIKSGVIHAIMGKNGSGKSTLAKIIAGHPSYTITEGDILFENVSILFLFYTLNVHIIIIQGPFLFFSYSF